MMQSLVHGPAASPLSAPAAGEIAARFHWTEYEQLMISEAIHRGETVYNVALRVDPASLMHAAAFQLIRNVLHSCGTVIALRPEDNSAAESLEIVEAALASHQPQEHIAQRCRIPSIVSDIRVERAATPESAEHELLGDLLEAQAASVASKAAETGGDSSAARHASARLCGRHRCRKHIACGCRAHRRSHEPCRRIDHWQVYAASQPRRI